MPPPPVPPGLANIFQNILSNAFSNAFGPSPRSGRTGFNRESIDDLDVVERLIPTSTLSLFLDFLLEGSLFSGRKTNLPLITEDEVPLFGKPYANWAPAPWNRQPSSFQERIISTPERFNVTVPRKISCMRARLWEGMVPMTGARWNERRLDDPKNWQCVFEIISETLNVFVWLDQPEITNCIKDNFNYIANEMWPFQSALNARRAASGGVARVDLKALWLEYMTDLFETMVHRTYSWVHDRIDGFLAKGKTVYEAAADAKGAVNANVEAKIFVTAWADLNKLHTAADYGVMMPLDGFQGFPARNRAYTMVVGSLPPASLRREQRAEMTGQLQWTHTERILEDPQALYQNREDISTVMQELTQNDEHLRKEQRGEPKKLGREHWIGIIHSRTQWSLSRGGPRDQKWGFVVYMLTQRPTTEEWVTFKSRLYADFARSGQWVEGFEEVKVNMDLQWIDGKDVGLAHDDVEGAKRHFKAFSATPAMRRRAWKQDFFVIDTASFASYMDPPTAFQERPPYGDYGGFLTLIDTATYPAQLIHEQAPGYQNKLRVLSSTVFDDVYPLVASLAQRPRDLWPLAMQHPNQVYVGPIVKTQEKDWDEIWRLRGIWWRCFWKWRIELAGNAPARS